MPQVANYNEVGDAKPGAVVLMDVLPSGHRRMPMLVTENYGRGRTAVFATSGSWRWKMWQDHTDITHATFWQQLMRYLVSDSPGRVSASTPRAVLADETKVTLRAEVRDKAYKPVPNAVVEAHIVGPDGTATSVEMTPVPTEEGAYTADWNAEKPGSYVTEIVAGRDKEELGRDVTIFRREDGVAENFHTAQNRELLRKLADETGGRYYSSANAGRLADEISYSEAGITTRETKDLWDMPVFFAGSGAARVGVDAAAADGVWYENSANPAAHCRFPSRVDLLRHRDRPGRRAGLRTTLRHVGQRYRESPEAGTGFESGNAGECHARAVTRNARWHRQDRQAAGRSSADADRAWQLRRV